MIADNYNSSVQAEIQNSTSSSSANNSTLNNSKIVFSGSCEYSAISFEEECDLYCMASLQAPNFEPNSQQERKGVDLLCIVDKSGSMAGQKLDMVKATLSFMVDSLKEMDRVAIVEFDSYVRTSLELTNMNSEGKEKAKCVSSSLTSGSCTNLSDALFTGLSLLAKRKEKNEITSVILFTDGLANRGLVTTTEILQNMRDLMDELLSTSNVSVHTFGFGQDTDANMLTSIAKSGNGLYDFLEHADDIPKAFGNVIGNLLSVVGQNVKIRIQPKPNICLKKVLTGYRISDLPNGEGCEITVGDVYSEEKKDILFILSVPRLYNPRETQELAQVSLSYFNIIETDNELVGFDITINRNPKLETFVKSQDNYQLDVQKNRIEVSQAMSQAKTYGDSQKLEEGRIVLSQSIAKVQNSISGKDAFCQGLVQDLRKCLQNMEDSQSYTTVGNRMLNNCHISNEQQRSTSNTMSSAQVAYSTPQQRLYSEAFVLNITQSPKKQKE